MLDTKTPIDWKAKDFALKGIDGKSYSLADVRGPKGTLVVFICNHCPYVKASIGRIVAEAKALREVGIGTIAVTPNDVDAYPENSFDNMKKFAAQHGFTFPYVIDSTQEVARVYAAQCTPHFFGFNADDELQYRGRLDAARMNPVPSARRDLYEAMKEVPDSGHGPSKFRQWFAPSNGAWVTERDKNSGLLATHATFLRHRVATTHTSVHARGVQFGDAGCCRQFIC
jgi:peroxiredoxin